MRDPARIKKLLDELEKYWVRTNTDLRLCQIIENLLPTERTCLRCNGKGFIRNQISSDSSDTLPCIRCDSKGIIFISNYSVEDETLISKLETLNELQSGNA